MGFGKIQFPSWLSSGIIIKGPTQSSDIVKDEKSALPPTRRRTGHPTRRGNQEPTIMNRLSTYLKTKLTSTLSEFEILDDATSIIRYFLGFSQTSLIILEFTEGHKWQFSEFPAKFRNNSFRRKSYFIIY